MENDAYKASKGHAIETTRHVEIERILLQIWSEVLNTESISVNVDFLGLGGDSLAAMRCINRISTIFAVELSIDLFLLHSASICELASEIARLQIDTNQTIASGTA